MSQPNAPATRLKMDRRADALDRLLRDLAAKRGKPAVSLHLYDACHALAEDPKYGVQDLFRVTAEAMTPWETFARDLREAGTDRFRHRPSSSVYWLREASETEPPAFPVAPDESKARVDYIKRGIALRASARNAATPAAEPSATSTQQGIDQVEWPTLSEVLGDLRTNEATKTLVFRDEQLRALHYAWHCRPTRRFVILSGLSGTGKTNLVDIYAHLWCKRLGLDPDTHYVSVAVSPDWRDPSSLLGYPNTIREVPTFHAEPALRLLLEASRHPDHPYFLLLDEMNLAHPERYFAPVLSAMERRAGHGKVHLHSFGSDVDGVPQTLTWPENVFVAGTLNADETTHALSDKVLDRAFNLEFWDVDLEELFKRRPCPHSEVVAVLMEINATLEPVRRHLGYRAVDDIARFVEAVATDADPAEKAATTTLVRDSLDQALVAKALTKLRGEHTPEFEKALLGLAEVARAHQLTRTARKVGMMLARLQATGVTAFWA
mgnify:CR=1 FL=1